MLWEVCITHGTFERFWPRSFEAKATPLAIVMASAAWVPCRVLGLCVVTPLAVLAVHLGFGPCAWMTQPVLGRYPCRRGSRPCLQTFLGNPLLSGLGTVEGQYGGLDQVL
jgi:hypothetical protein